jgi:hypothetical protein
MDFPQQPSPAPTQPPAPQPAANLNLPELPHAPEKLLTPPHEKNGSWGALAGSIVIILVLIVGALYFWGAKLAEEESADFIPEETPLTESAEQ